MITSVMLARQISLLTPLPTKLTPLLRYSYKLLVAPKKVNSFAIKQIRTLSVKHPGWGLCRRGSRTHESRVTYANSFPCHTYEKRAKISFFGVRKFFRCHTYKIALPQVLPLPHIQKTGGCPSLCG